MHEATIEVYRSRLSRPSQRWRWRLRHANGRLIATSGEGYTDLSEAKRQAGSVVRGSYADAPYLML